MNNSYDKSDRIKIGIAVVLVVLFAFYYQYRHDNYYEGTKRLKSGSCFLITADPNVYEFDDNCFGESRYLDYQDRTNEMSSFEASYYKDVNLYSAFIDRCDGPIEKYVYVENIQYYRVRENSIIIYDAYDEDDNYSEVSCEYNTISYKNECDGGTVDLINRIESVLDLIG